MSTNARIQAAMQTMVQGIDVPPIRLDVIQRKISQPQPVARPQQRLTRFALATAAAVTILAVTLPAVSPAFVQSLEARYRAALQALGGIAPPAAPKSLISQLTPHNEHLASAQSRVAFTIVPPAGLPRDIVSSTIQVSPTGLYSTQTHSWRVGPLEVRFVYRRAGGHEFILIADRYNPNGELPAKYIFEAKAPTAGGRPVLVRHEHFAWRNGNQMMTATEGSAISAAEIAAIQSAMHGIAVPRRNLHAPTAQSTMTLRVLTKP